MIIYEVVKTTDENGALSFQNWLFKDKSDAQAMFIEFYNEEMNAKDDNTLKHQKVSDIHELTSFTSTYEYDYEVTVYYTEREVK